MKSYSFHISKVPAETSKSYKATIATDFGDDTQPARIFKYRVIVTKNTATNMGTVAIDWDYDYVKNGELSIDQMNELDAQAVYHAKRQFGILLM